MPFYLFCSAIDVDFCFHVEYFLPTIFFISYQYKSTNNWVCTMRQMWNFCCDGKSVTTTMNNWTCARWESCWSKFQPMTLPQNALVLHTTHQPAKPVETINTSHVFAAETIKTKLLNKNSPLNVEAAKNKANVKTKFIWFWSSKTTCLSIFKWSVRWVAKYFDTSKSPKFPHF